MSRALAYATGKLHGAAALSPAGTGILGQVAGYTVADYLIQHASQERRYTRVPASTWDAILGHIRDPADAVQLADSATNRLLYCYAIPLYRHAVDTGNRAAMWRLLDLLVRRGDLDGVVEVLRARADAGDDHATSRLVDVLTTRGDLDEAAQVPQARADVGDGYAVSLLADLLARRGDLDRLRAQADADDRHAVRRLADLLATLGDLDRLRSPG